MNFEELEKKVENICGPSGWNLYEEATILAQADKLIEEATELRDAIFAKTQGLTSFIDKKGTSAKDVEEEIIDGSGDVMVVLKNICVMTGYDMKFCFNSSIEVIAKRQEKGGKMIGGTFVKVEDQ